MNKQRKVLITTTYNEMGIIIDTKAEEVAQPEVAKDTNVLTNDCISRQEAIDAIKKCRNESDMPDMWYDGMSCALRCIYQLPSAQPKAIRPKFVAEDRYLKNHFQTFPHCPKCNYELETGDCYCRVCGCHIDWSEDDG